MLDPALDGALVALAGAPRGLLPAPAEAVQQAADMIAVITNPEALPEQIGDALCGPHPRREAVGFRSPRQQAWELGQLSPSHLRGPSRSRPTAQSRRSSPTILLRPLMDRLTTHTQLPGNPRQRLALLDARQHRQAACLQPFSVSSHERRIRHVLKMSSYLCRGL